MEIIGDKTKFDVKLSRKISLLNLNSDTDLLNNDIYLSLIVESKNTELVQVIKDFIQIKDENNSTDNNPDNGEVKPEAPEVPEQSPETKPEAPEVPGVPEEAPEIPDEIKDLIDTEVVTAVSGNGTKESPLQLDVNNVSSTKVNEFLNNFN